MPALKYRGISAFARGVRNILYNLKRMGETFSKGGDAERQAVKNYAIALDKFVKENLSGKTIPLSKKSLNDKTLSKNTFIGRGGMGRGTKSISIRITGTNQSTNMIGRALKLDEGGLIKAKPNKFLTIPLGRGRQGVKGSVRDYSPGTTFQIYADKAARGQRVTKHRKPRQPRYLVLRGPGREFTPVYLFTTKTKIPSYKWIQDASQRAKKLFEKDMPARMRAFNLLSRSKNAKVKRA